MRKEDEVRLVSETIEALQGRIAKLRKELRANQAKLAKLTDGDDSLSPAGMSRRQLVLEDYPDSLANKIIGIFNRQPTSSFSVAELADQLRNESRPSLRATLTRLEKRGRLEREGHGRYCLPPDPEDAGDADEENLSNGDDIDF